MKEAAATKEFKKNEVFDDEAQKEFLKGAKIAYETIITDFSDNDNKLTTSKPLLNHEIYNQFNEALKDLKIAKVIDGYRGSKAINMEQLIQNIFKLQEFVVRNSSELSELEINPFLVTASRAVAVDALIKM